MPGLGRVGGWRPRCGPQLCLQKNSGQGQQTGVGTVEGEGPLGIQHGGPEPRAPDFPRQLGGLRWGLWIPLQATWGQGNLPDLTSASLQPGTMSNIKNSFEESAHYSDEWLCAPHSVSGTPRITLACTNRVRDRKFSVIYSIKDTPNRAGCPDRRGFADNFKAMQNYF